MPGGGELRAFRVERRRYSQVSPPLIAWEAIGHVRGDRVLDVGCGSGIYGHLLRVRWPRTSAWLDEGILEAEALVGVDARADAGGGVYDAFVNADATAVPTCDSAFDTALCLETVEHLQPSQAQSLLAELTRVASRRVIVSTPAPWHMVDDAWLRGELEAAQRDPVPMGYAEYCDLAGGMHKTRVSPTLMREAGFEVPGPECEGSLVYVGEVGALDSAGPGPLAGIEWDPSPPGASDYRSEYVRLLEIVTTFSQAPIPVAEREAAAAD